MTWTFDAPGNLQDFSNPTDWQKEMVDQADYIVQVLVGSVLNKRPEDVTDAEVTTWRTKLAYVQPTREGVPAGAETISIQPWGGFPRGVERQAPWAAFPPAESDPDGSFRAVDNLGIEDFGAGHFEDSDGTVLDLPTRHRQDEYLEWVATPDGQGGMSKITFVAEGYDYFAKLFEKDPKTVVDLFGKFTGIGKITDDQLRVKKAIRWVPDDAGPRQEVKVSGYSSFGAFWSASWRRLIRSWSTTFASRAIVLMVTFCCPASIRERYCCVRPVMAATSACFRRDFRRASLRLEPNIR